MSATQKHDTMTQGIAATPSLLAIIWTKVLDLPVATWVGIISICFILLQMCHLLWKWHTEWLDRKERRNATRAAQNLPQPSDPGI